MAGFDKKLSLLPFSEMKNLINEDSFEKTVEISL